MENWETKVERLMAIEDPRKAYIAIATDQELRADEMEMLVHMYTEKHNVDSFEMAFYPNGEQVLTPDVFW